MLCLYYRIQNTIHTRVYKKSLVILLLLFLSLHSHKHTLHPFFLVYFLFFPSLIQTYLYEYLHMICNSVLGCQITTNKKHSKAKRMLSKNSSGADRSKRSAYYKYRFKILNKKMLHCINDKRKLFKIHIWICGLFF